jgi:drug/metabolite transporter (DMT)-like permease
MTLGSLAYVINDGLVRAATEEGLDVYQALFLRGCAMVAILAAATAARHGPIDRRWVTAPVRWRLAAEVAGTATFFAAIVNLEFANAQTILMLVPFLVTVVAARLGEPVGPAMYALVAIGFVGVIAVVRPTPSGFSPWALLAVAAALALVGREFATRRISSEIPPLAIALFTAVSITTTMGALSLVTGWGPVSTRSLLILALACVCLVAGYLFVIETVRVGDLSVTAPFRYTAVVGAVAVGLVLFDERPDNLTLLGCGLIIVAGVLAARFEAGDRPRRRTTIARS